MTNSRFPALCLFLVGCCAVFGQENWLPPRVESGAVDQLTARLEAIGPNPVKDRAALRGGMQLLVRQVRAQLESWKVKGVLDRAPVFPELNLPASEQPRLDAMGRYQVCNWALVNQQSESYDRETRRNGAVASTAVTMAIIYLRQLFEEQGGKPEQIKAHLTGPAMDLAFQQAMANKESVSYIEKQCQPLITEMFTALK